jgi:hypothetical protein
MLRPYLRVASVVFENDAHGFQRKRSRQQNICRFTIPIDHPECDGTLEWHRKTLVLGEIRAGGRRGRLQLRA